MADKTATTDSKSDASAAPTTPAPTPKRGPGHRGAEVKDTVAEMAAKAHEISLEAGSRMAAAMKDVINAAAGITGFVVESARDLAQYMVRRGQMTQEEADKLIQQAEEAQLGKPPHPSSVAAILAQVDGPADSKAMDSKAADSKAADSKATAAKTPAKTAEKTTEKAAEKPATQNDEAVKEEEGATSKTPAAKKATSKTASKAASKTASKAASKTTSKTASKTASKTPAKTAAKKAASADKKPAAKKTAAKKK